MRKLFTFITITLLLAACNKEEIVPEVIVPIPKPIEEIRVLTLSADSLVFSHMGGVKSLDVETNGNWTITDVPTWATLSQTSGIDTVKNITVTIGTDALNTKREAKITVKSGNITKKLNILQHKEIRTTTIAVVRAGMVKSLLEPLSDEVLTLIKLTGLVNYADLTYLRVANKQLHLDLSDVTIVEGERHTGEKWVVSPSNILDSGALSDFSNLETLVLPNNITQIRNNALSNCTGLKSTIIPSQIISIGYEAFYNCASLQSIILPNNVIAVGQRAFMMCTNLKNLTLSGNMTSIEAETFANCGSLVNFTFPPSVTYIHPKAFKWCTSLTNINFSRNHAYIADEAFWGCSKLTSVSIPSNEQELALGRNVFFNCTSLRSVYSPYATPPIIPISDGRSGCFDLEYLDVCTLYVPYRSGVNYDIDRHWGTYQFRQIVEFN